MKFGVREICDVTFKSTDTRTIGSKTFVQYQPVFMIDTATASELTQEATTVYAQGGKGYNRLIAWEGEKNMTFKVTDALMSPMGLHVLTSAGLIKAGTDTTIHVHVLVQKTIDAQGKATITLDELREELGLDSSVTTVNVCADSAITIYGTLVDGSGAGVDWINEVTVASATGTASKGFYAITSSKSLVLQTSDGSSSSTATTTYANKTAIFDFYVGMKENATQIDIKPEDFGGYFYVEADTLFRREDTGADMAATLTFPKVKVQSGFTFSMAATGDPSTFDFTMDAFPGYTQFDHENKVCVSMAIVGSDDAATASASASGHLSESAEHSSASAS